MAMITGAAGLARAVDGRATLGAGWRVVALPRTELDNHNEGDVRNAVELFRPDVLINCAATADVDRCEFDRDWLLPSTRGPRFLARACREFGATSFT